MRRFILPATVTALLLFAGACMEEQPGDVTAPEARLSVQEGGEALTDYSPEEVGAQTQGAVPEIEQATIDRLAIYTDRAAFDGVCPTLPLEDFEEGNVSAGGVVGCPGPLDDTNNDACFSPGDILPGVEFNSSTPRAPDPELALIGAGFFGSASKNIVANFFVDWFIVRFAPGVTGIGADLTSYFSADACVVDIYGTSGLLGSTAAACSNAGSFFGVHSSEPITRIEIFSPAGTAEGVDNIAFGICVIFVDIDIKPGGFPNSINCNNDRGVIPVAILSTSVADGDALDFDVADVDHTTVTFEGASETHVDKKTGLPRRHMEDVDGDGDMDLVFHFRYGDTGLTCASTEGTLMGFTYGGTPIEGTDTVRMVGG